MDAVCNNTKGAFNCSCKPGYRGDGRNCTGKIFLLLETIKGENVITVLLLKVKPKTLLLRVS